MNYFDYLNWRGDITLKVVPFNLVDNLLFSELCYLDFRDIVGKDKISISEAHDRYFELHQDDKKASKIETGEKLFKEIVKSDRFKDTYLYNHINILDKDEAVQFSATCFLLPDKTHYVAFRGTDDYLISWKEDLQMSYLNKKNSII